MSALPIDEALPALRAALETTSAAVLQAPPGAGKTTRVPLALLEEGWLGHRKIIMLEPRRLAARAAARRMADTLRERVGDTVGHRMHRDTRVGPATRIEVVTEGVLTRLLQDDPTLEGVGLVIFDEFHERSLNADLGLALTLHSQQLLRPELRLLVMSATLDVEPVTRVLGGAPLIASEGRQFPVETRYRARPADAVRDIARTDAALTQTIVEALRDETGDVLVFLPGAAEIRRIESRLHGLDLGPGVFVAPLYGNLSQEEQDRALLPSPASRRKIVLATAIAETSLTIDGVRVVVDGGLARVPRFSPRTGMTRLETVRVSRASADQRRGRAGRLGAGVCYRLWSEVEDGHLVPRATPEILEADLAPLALELAAAVIADPLELRWLDPPPAAALAQGRELLDELTATDADGRITSHGKRMARLGVHPRLAHMLLRAVPLGLGGEACALAAIVNERDVLRNVGGPPSADLRTRLDLLRDPSAAERDAVDRDALRRVAADAKHLARTLGVADTVKDVESAGMLLAFAYPDRVAKRREARGRYLLRNGRGAAIESPELGDSEFVVIAAVDDRQPESRVFLAAPVTLADIEHDFAEQVATERVIEWDEASQSVIARRRRRLGAIVLADAPLRDPEPEEVARALVDGVLRRGIDALPWSEGARRLRQRLAFLHRLDSSWPDVGDEALAGAARTWLAAHAVGMRSIADVSRLDLADALLGLLDWEQRRELDAQAPTHFVAPSGSRLPIEYADPEAPVLAVRLQEMFGLADTPRIARGRVPLTLHLLSPAHRPVQVTRDLAGFWRTSYFDVKREMRGRYPKHHWPDDPLSAEPTRRAKRRG